MENEFPFSNFHFPFSDFEGGKSAAQQLRRHHTALGGIGEWVVGSLRYYSWWELFSPLRPQELCRVAAWRGKSFRKVLRHPSSTVCCEPLVESVVTDRSAKGALVRVAKKLLTLRTASFSVPVLSAGRVPKFS
jgi:hypothetical protein